jgi:hypothetical protein
MQLEGEYIKMEVAIRIAGRFSASAGNSLARCVGFQNVPLSFFDDLWRAGILAEGGNKLGGVGAAQTFLLRIRAAVGQELRCGHERPIYGGAACHQRTTRPPEMKRRNVAFADGLFPRRLDADVHDGQVIFNQLAVVAHSFNPFCWPAAVSMAAAGMSK